MRVKRNTRFELMTVGHNDTDFIKLLMSGGAKAVEGRGPKPLEMSSKSKSSTSSSSSTVSPKNALSKRI